MQAELDGACGRARDADAPVLALVGGAKVSTKLDLLRFLIGKVDISSIGGAMANTLLFAQGREIGRSLCERDMADSARQILALARQRELPSDPARGCGRGGDARAGRRRPDGRDRARFRGHDDPRYRPGRP